MDKYAFMEGYFSKVSEDHGRFDKRDLLAFMPLIGGLPHGAAKNPEGTSRAEAGLVQGLMGLGGGVVGGLGGAGLGAILGKDVIGDAVRSNDSEQAKKFAAIVAVASLLGSSLGTAAGSFTGKALGRRDVMTVSDWKNLAAQNATA
jgi:hypothetical protein